MEKTEAIRRHPLFQQEYGRILVLEENRLFCRHNMEHLLAVARLMYIYSLEEKANISKELLYAAALLHDIGRAEEAEKGTPHSIAGARIAGEILADCGFPPEEVWQVQKAISSHRQAQGEKDRLAAYLYRADKQSRPCFACPAEKACNWPEEKKNKHIFY